MKYSDVRLTKLLRRVDEGIKSAAYAYDRLSNKETAFSSEANETAFNSGLRTDKNLWEFFDEPDNSHRLYRFGMAMQGLQKMEPQHLLPNGQ